MVKLTNINYKSNAQVFPVENDLNHLPGAVPVDEEIENTNIRVPVFYGETGSEINFVQKNALHPLFSPSKERESNDGNTSKKKNSDGRKLKTFEIVGEFLYFHPMKSSAL